MTIHNINELPELDDIKIVVYRIGNDNNIWWNIINYNMNKSEELLDYELVHYQKWFYLHELLSDNIQLLSKDYILPIHNNHGI